VNLVIAAPAHPVRVDHAISGSTFSAARPKLVGRAGGRWYDSPLPAGDSSGPLAVVTGPAEYLVQIDPAGAATGSLTMTVTVTDLPAGQAARRTGEVARA
jgi:hypothetical protein